jgi:hypothetical protein
MAEVGVSMATPHLDALHEKAMVFSFHNVTRFERLRETRPSGTRIEFVEGGKEWLSRYDINVNPLPFIVPIFVAKGWLSAAFLGDLGSHY